MKKSIMVIGISTFMVYNAIPIINLIFPKSIRYTFLIDLWIINNLWALIVSIFFCMKYGFKIYIPFFVAGLFFPTMYIVYNDSAMIYTIGYFILSFFGSLIGGRINTKKEYKS